MNGSLDLVVVTHNSAAVLQSFLNSVPEGIKVIVADNHSTDKSVVVARAAGAQVVEIGENVGYGCACNIGAGASSAPMLLFANPDLRLRPGAVEELVSAAETFSNAAFNPRIYSGRRRRFRKWSRLLPASAFWRGSPPESDCSIPVLHGSCILVRRDHFEAIGGFDPKIFLFHEDDDLSLRLRQAGIELRLAAKAVVDHAEGNSSGKSSRSGRIKGEAMGRSLVYVMDKHHLNLDVSVERHKAWLKLLSPHVLFNGARRSKVLGFLHGLDGGPMDQIGGHP